MKLTRPFRKRELILMWVCLIIVAGILTGTVIRRINIKFSRLEEEIVFNQEKLLRLNTILRQAKELNSQYEKLLFGYKELKDANGLLQEIETVAKKMNINILSIKPGVTKDEDLYKTYSVKIEAQDEISSLARFLSALAEEMKSINIEQLQINAQSKGGLPKAGILISAAAFKI